MLKDLISESKSYIGYALSIEEILNIKEKTMVRLFIERYFFIGGEGGGHAVYCP